MKPWVQIDNLIAEENRTRCFIRVLLGWFNFEIQSDLAIFLWEQETEEPKEARTNEEEEDTATSVTGFKGSPIRKFFTLAMRALSPFFYLAALGSHGLFWGGVGRAILSHGCELVLLQENSPLLPKKSYLLSSPSLLVVWHLTAVQAERNGEEEKTSMGKGLGNRARRLGIKSGRTL